MHRRRFESKLVWRDRKDASSVIRTPYRRFTRMADYCCYAHEPEANGIVARYMMSGSGRIAHMECFVEDMVDTAIMVFDKYSAEGGERVQLKIPVIKGRNQMIEQVAMFPGDRLVVWVLNYGTGEVPMRGIWFSWTKVYETVLEIENEDKRILRTRGTGPRAPKGLPEPEKSELADGAVESEGH